MSLAPIFAFRRGNGKNNGKIFIDKRVALCYNGLILDIPEETNMKEFVHWLLSENNSDLKITLFNEWHIFYLLIAFGTAFAVAFIFKDKPEDKKEKVLRTYAYITIGLYIADFFLMPLSDSYGGRIAIHKLPFHICTLMSVLATFAQFNKKFKPVKEPIVVLSLVSALMWMTYPGSALGGEPPFSYVIAQTFMFHSFLFGWAFLNLALGEVKLSIVNVWQELLGILLICAWANLGNTLYEDQNWFFLADSIFEFIPDDTMPVTVISAVFLMCLLIYGIYYAVRAIIVKNYENGKKQARRV